MEKSTAYVGFFVSFMVGMGVMYVAKNEGPGISAEQPAAEAGEAVDETDSPIPVGKDDPQWGKPDALVTIVEISDFQCPFCSRVNPTLKKIKEQYGPDKVRIVWKHNPLPFHKAATPAHEASQAVFSLGGSDAFWKFHDLAFENQKDLTPENFSKWAVASGVDKAKFEAALKDASHGAKVKKDLAANRKIGATGTPAFRINGFTLSGAQPLPKFTEVIDRELKEAEKLLKSGTKRAAVSVARTKENFKAAPAADEQKRREPEDDKTVWRVNVDKSDPSKGPADALVTITEWSDFQCPFCSRVNPTIAKIRETYPDTVRVVWKDNPLPFHKRATPASVLARAAFEKGGDDLFWKVHDEIFNSQRNLEDEDLEKIAQKFGMSWNSMKTGPVYDKHKAKIDETMESGSDINVRGTPHFFINGRRLSGAQPFEKFKELIDEELKKAEALVARGTAKADVYATIMKTAKGSEPPERRDVPAPTKANPYKGGANAKVVIQEFSDFQCPFCSRVNPTLAQIKQEYGDKVKVVWRNMPLAFHKDAPLAAEAAYEAFMQKGNDGFWAFHDKLFENQKSIQRPDLEKYAQELGLDMTKFKAALDSNTHKKIVDADMDAAKKAGVTGTPAFTINGYFLSGAQPFPKFKKLIDVALKEAK